MLLVCIALVFLAALFYVWYQKADADLTLLWNHQFINTRPNEFAGRVVWVTGASSGIGEEVAYAFARLGASLALSGTRVDALERVRLNCLAAGAAAALVVAFDIADCDFHQRKLAEVVNGLGSPEVLVNNAGILQRAEFTASSVEVEKKLFDVNVFGVTNLCRVVVNHWLSTGQDMCRLSVTSSAAGKMGSPFSAAYSGSKHALHGYLETLRDELSCAESFIKITIACPGPVRSQLRVNALTATVGERYNKVDTSSQRKLMDTRRCAELIVTGIRHSLDELWIAEQPLLTLFYVYQYFPSVFRRFLIRFVMTKSQIEKFRKGE